MEKNNKTCGCCECISFTKEEIKTLKELAKEKIFSDNLAKFDKEGNPIPYRNRYSIEPPHLLKEKN